MSNGLDINIDINNITKGIKDLERYSHKLDLAIDAGIDELVEKLRLKVIERLIAYGLGDSDLISKVNVVRSSDGIRITVDSEHAFFVEYGTGIVGSTHPHPKIAGWIYDVKGNGESGWWYPTKQSDPNPIKWVDGSGQLRAWTKGMASRPFMYDTWLYGRRIFTQIIRKHIRGITL